MTSPGNFQEELEEKQLESTGVPAQAMDGKLFVLPAALLRENVLSSL